MALWTKSRWRWAGTSLLLVTVFGVPGDAQDQQPPQPPPIFRTGINVVRVDVIVTDSKTGQPVADLKQSDFQVTEDNKPQTVETFKLIKLDGGRVPGAD